MFEKTDLIDRVEWLVDRAILAGYNVEYIRDLLDILIESINDYYSMAIEGSVRRCIVALSHETRRATMQGHDAPPPIDITAIFSAPSTLMQTTERAFFDSIAEELDEVTGAVIGYESDLIESIVSAFDTEAETIPAYLMTVSTEAETAFQIDPIKTLFQPPAVHACPLPEEIAQRVFLDYGFLEIILVFGLPIFVPSCVNWQRGAMP